MYDSSGASEKKGEPITVKVSHYTPWTGGVNCARFVNGECLSKMSNGQPWQDWIDKAIACPAEIPFESIIVVDGQEWICKDRGGAIVYTGNAYWIDMLTASPQYKYGQEVDATIIYP